MKTRYSLLIGWLLTSPVWAQQPAEVPKALVLESSGARIVRQGLALAITAQPATFCFPAMPSRRAAARHGSSIARRVRCCNWLETRPWSSSRPGWQCDPAKPSQRER